MTNWQITTRPEQNKVILESQRTVEAFTIQDAIDYASFGILGAKTRSNVDIPSDVQDRVFEEAQKAQQFPRL